MPWFCVKNDASSLERRCRLSAEKGVLVSYTRLGDTVALLRFIRELSHAGAHRSRPSPHCNSTHDLRGLELEHIV